MPEESKHSRIFAELRKEILDGRHSAGRRFPSEAELVRRFGVSRITVTKVMEALVADGLVVRRRGSGTFVSPAARRRTGQIGLIVPSLAYGEIFPVISQGVVRAAAEKGYSVVLGSVSSPDPKRRVEEARASVRALIDQRAAGVIFQPFAFLDSSDEASAQLLSDLDAGGVPTVLIDRNLELATSVPHDFVGLDNFAAGRALARHFLSEGVKRFMFFLRPKCASVIGERFAGVHAAVEGLGAVKKVMADPQNVRAVRAAFRGRLPQAVICESDYVAASLRATLRKAGVAADGIRFAGFDDVRCSQLMPSPYATMRQPCEDLAKVAFSLLMDRLAHPAEPTRKILLSAALSVR